MSERLGRGARVLPLLLATLVLGVRADARQVTSPADHLGRPVGADFELADWQEIQSYHERLAAESPRVLVESVGTTTEGRDFLLTTISSEENLARLDEIRRDAHRLADPRGLAPGEREALLARARPVVFVSLGMHSTETAAPQFGMELAYLLATSDEEPYASARREVVCLIAPCLNPDGLDEVVSWYRKTVGTPYESSSLLRLYQHYAGHDNNRDWFMLSQNETRIVTRLLYSEWFPQVYWDVHQQGTSSERMFVPPFRDPLDPNLDPGVIAGIDQLGTRALFDMTRGGLRGVSTGVTYDMWWNGGNRNVPVRHNVIGLLTEAASVRIASPVFLPPGDLRPPGGLGGYAPSNRFPAPWPGGWWRLRDIIDYEHGFARSLLASLAREPRLWLRNALEAGERAIVAAEDDAPRAWIVPSTNPDVDAVERLVDTLLLGGVEVHVTDAELEADDRTWPAGSLVLLRAQPYGQHVKDLFEVQRYPEGDAPYDVAGWTLPLLLGVRRIEVMEALDPAGLRLAESAAGAVAGFAPPGEGSGDARDGRAWKALFRHLVGGGVAHLSPEGRLVLAEPPAGDDPPPTVRGMPRIGVYAPWSGSMDEGWTRYVLDRFGVPFVSVRNEMLRAGDLGAFLDVLLLPGASARQLEEGRAAGSVPAEYSGGLGAEGAAAVADFVRGGGRLVALGSSSPWAVDLFELPLVDVTRGEEQGDFSCPGSVLRATPGDDPVLAGIEPSTALFFSHSAAWRVEEPAKDAVEKPRIDVLLRYAPTYVLLSGWIRQPEVVEGKAAWVRASVGEGSVHLFGFGPQYRGWSQAAFYELFRALVL